MNGKNVKINGWQKFNDNDDITVDSTHSNRAAFISLKRVILVNT